MDVSNLIQSVQKEYDVYTQNEYQLQQLQQSLEAAKQRQVSVSKAVIVIQEVAQNVQRQLEGHVTNLVNLAIRSVFADPPEFVMNVVTKRNRAECELLFRTGDSFDKPIESSGGGLLDIVSFALRVVLWTFTTLDNTLILDEPFKNVSPDLAPKVSDMVYELSDKLNLQIIMVSHAVDINMAAQKTFVVTNNNETSSIKTL